MMIDALLSFTNGPLSMVGGAGVAIPSPNIIDLAGPGVGVPVPNIWGKATSFGAPDAMGVGSIRPELVVTISTLLVTGNAATLNAALQAAADNGSNQPGAWNTLVETGAIAVANLTAGQLIARFPWVPPFPPGLRPRFLRMLFSPAAATNFTAGALLANVTVVRDDQFNQFVPKNFAV